MTPKGIVVYEGPSALNGAPIVAIATNLKRPSANQKTGPVVQVWILPADVRPHVAVKSGADAAVCGDCKHRPSLEGTCYVPTFRAPGAVHAAFLRGSYARPTPSEARALLAGRVVRLGAWGDPVAVPLVVWRALLRDVKGWTGYTHQWRLPVARPYQALLMASVDSRAEYDAARADGWRCFGIHAESEPRPALPGLRLCPASDEAPTKDVVTCATCRLCDGNDRGARRPSVIIAMHGAKSRRMAPAWS